LAWRQHAPIRADGASCGHFRSVGRALLRLWEGR
jgi:hypothetical protein